MNSGSPSVCAHFQKLGCYMLNIRPFTVDVCYYRRSLGF